MCLNTFNIKISSEYKMIPEKSPSTNPNRYEPENGSLVATLTGWTVLLILSPIWLPIVIYTLMIEEDIE